MRHAEGLLCSPGKEGQRGDGLIEGEGEQLLDEKGEHLEGVVVGDDVEEEVGLGLSDWLVHQVSQGNGVEGRGRQELMMADREDQDE